MLLIEYLSDHDITITDFAKSIGCSRPAVSYWLAGKTRPTPHHTKKIAKATDGSVTANDLHVGWEIMQREKAWERNR